jgi:uncharacterized damage-inducible protein DinB
MSLLNSHIAKHFRDFHFGGNWTSVNLKDSLSDVNWQEATQEVNGCNTIAKISYHIHYYVHAVLQVLRGGSLDAHDKYSFDHPPINSQEDWDSFLENCWKEAEEFAGLVEKMQEEKIWKLMNDKKYGNYFRNLQGIIEHSHYHLGQIIILKKIIKSVN